MYFLYIFLTAFFVNFFLLKIRRKIIKKEDEEKIKKLAEEIREKVKKGEKIPENVLNEWINYMHKSFNYFFIVILIIIPVFALLNYFFAGKIIIPLPFEIPKIVSLIPFKIVYEPGLGWLASYIISSILSSLILRFLFKQF